MDIKGGIKRLPFHYTLMRKEVEAFKILEDHTNCQTL